MDELIESYASILETVSAMTSQHLESVEIFRATGFPGSPVADMHFGAVSLPGFRRQDPNRPMSPGEQTSRGADDLFGTDPTSTTRTGSTCSIVRSLIRSPGLSFSNIRPLQLLLLWNQQLEEGRRVGPALVERTKDDGGAVRLREISTGRNLFALGQIAVTVHALLEALPVGPIGDEPTPDFIIGEALYRLRKDVREDLRSDDAWFHLYYALHRLIALDRMCFDRSGQPVATKEPLAKLSAAAVPGADPAVRDAAMPVVEQIRHAFDQDTGTTAFDTWLDAHIRRCNESGAFAVGSPATTGRGVEHDLSRNFCWAILRKIGRYLTEAPRSFDELKLGDLGPPHPYVLHWTLEGIRVCLAVQEKQWATRPAFLDDVEVAALNEVRTGLVETSRQALYHVLAEAFDEESPVDHYRLGYHLVVAATHDEAAVPVSMVANGIGVLAAGISKGAWPKRDRFFVTTQGEAFGFAPELTTYLVMAFQNQPQVAPALEVIVRDIVAALQVNAIRVGDEGLLTWATRLDSTTVNSDAWATGEVYSMLFVAQGLFASGLARAVQSAHGGSLPTHRGRAWDQSRYNSDLYKKMDGDIWRDLDSHDDPTGWMVEPGPQVGRTLAENLCKPLRSRHGFFAAYNLSGRADRATMIRSGIIYGPPGTGKTTVVEALADFLGWPLITLDPADFLRDGREGVARAAREIFGTLSSLRDVVIFMDEMEELVRHRAPGRAPDPSDDDDDHIDADSMAGRIRARVQECNGDRSDSDGPDVLQRLWTTTLLTQLQQLHDTANVIFLVATNHFEALDPAIVRAGRFDFRLHLLPPSPARKLEMLSELIGERSNSRITPDQCATLTAVVQGVTEPSSVNMGSGASAGDVMKPGGTVRRRVPQPVRFTFMTWADTRRLAVSIASDITEAVGTGPNGEIKVDPSPGEIDARVASYDPERVRHHLNRLMPTAFDFHVARPRRGTMGLALP